MLDDEKHTLNFLVYFYIRKSDDVSTSGPPNTCIFSFYYLPLLLI